MASLDSLTDPQRAILQLLLKRGKSYGEIAALLKLDPSAVQSRAHDAVCALVSGKPDIGTDRRNELADHLLGQQSAASAALTREYLEGSAEARAWAHSAADALRPLAGDALPDLPSEAAELDRAFVALDAREARQQQAQRSSQMGTRLLFGALGLAVAVALILVLGIFGGDDGDKPTTATVTRTTPDEEPQAIAQGRLAPPSGSSSDASAQTAIVRYPAKNQFKLLIAAKKLPAAASGQTYGVWFYTNESNAQFVGVPKKPVADNGNLDVVADLPAETPPHRQLLITRESVEKPERPGRIVLRGKLTYATASQQGQTQTTP
ncbi:MAG: hypothetical protein WKF42_04855 [Solirubrobacteraceae bacterium]